MRFSGLLLVLTVSARIISGSPNAKDKTRCRIHDSTNNSSREIFADCSRRGLTLVPANLPADVTCLSLVGNSILKLNGTVWARYKSLRKLSLAHNNITSIQDSDLDGLDALEMLDLSHNYIRYTDISDNAFSPLKKLWYLDLKQALLGVWDNESFPSTLMHLPNLRSLMIDGVRNPSGPVLSNLTELFLSGYYGRCSIPKLTRSYWNRFQNIKNLSLAQCGIRQVENCFLKNLSNLVSIDLSKNKQLTLNAYANITCGLEGSKVIKRLNLNHLYNSKDFGQCAYIGVKGSKFLQNTSLEMLTLEKNYLVTVKRDAFKYFPSTLKYLSINRNMFTYGKYFNYLLQADILGNILYFDTSRMFQTHRIVSNPRGYRPEETRRHSAGTSCCSMFTRERFKDSFEAILERVHKYHSNTSEMYENVSNIEYLDVSSNLPNTYKMALALFIQAPFLQFLNLSDNFLGYPLLNGELCFKNLKMLRTLDISNNRLTKLPHNVFSNLTSIEELNLAKNELTNITFELSSLQKLVYLDLRSNHLEQIDEALRSFLDESKNFTIKLSHNPLKCSCKNIAFVKWLHSKLKFKQIGDPSETKCSFDNNTRLPVTRIRYDQFYHECSPPNYSVVILVSSLGLLIFLIVLSTSLVYKFRWNLRYLFYMTKFKLVGYQNIDSTEFEKDVFVSYASEDRKFVIKHILPELEEKGSLSLLVHDRDFKAGDFVADNILRAVSTTRRTLVVLTKAYVQSKWCMYEMNMARIEAADTGRNVLCVILKEDISTRYLLIEVIDIIKKKTYIEFPEEEQHVQGFWERLRATLINRA